MRNVQEWRDRNRKALECKDQRGESCYFKKEKFDLFIKSKCFQHILSLSSIAIYCHKDHEDNAMREGFQSQESISYRPCHQVFLVKCHEGSVSKVPNFYQSQGYKYKELKGQPKISNANIFLFRNSTFSKKATKTFRYLFSQTSGGRRDQSYPQWYPRQYSVRTVKVLCSYCGTTIGTIGLPACIQHYSVLL